MQKSLAMLQFMASSEEGGSEGGGGERVVKAGMKETSICSMRLLLFRDQVDVAISKLTFGGNKKNASNGLWQ
jgi:hypothetical protein